MQPIAQNQAYHDFADRGQFLGIPNLFAVISNIPFLLVGIAGLRYCRSSLLLSYRLAWVIFFAGVAIISAGSAWYHLNPNNDTLVWDRLPMTIAFIPDCPLEVFAHHSCPNRCSPGSIAA